MQPVILKITAYRDCPILIQRFGSIFQYIVLGKKKFYSKHNKIVVPIYRRIFGGTYTEKELQSATGICLAQAMTTVDFLLSEK